MIPRGVLLPAVLMLAAALSETQLVLGICALPKEEGKWVDADRTQPDTPKNLRLRFFCRDVFRSGLPDPRPSWKFRLKGKCAESDCNWGEVDAEMLGSGHIYAVFDQGFAQRHVYAKMSALRPGRLWVWIWTDFSDPNRKDFGVHHWYRRR